MPGGAAAAVGAGYTSTPQKGVANGRPAADASVTS